MAGISEQQPGRQTRLRDVFMARLWTLIPFGDRAARISRYDHLQKAYDCDTLASVEADLREIARLRAKNAHLRKGIQDVLDANP